MAVKETVVFTRPNKSVKWPWEVATLSSNVDTSSLYTLDSIVTNTSITSVRLWHNNSDFVNEKSKVVSVETNKEFFNYVVNNNITIARTFEIV